MRSLILCFLCATPVCASDFDLILSGGTIYDGTGAPPIVASVGIKADRVMAIGDLTDRTADQVIDVAGLAVTPGFINMLSWAVDSLVEDGRSESDIHQGVTLEVFGEGISWGPWNPQLKAWAKESQSDIRYDIEWTTLAEYLDYLVQRGVSPNVASFVGATTVRMHEVGFEDRADENRIATDEAAGATIDGRRCPGFGLLIDLRAGLLRTDR